MFVLLARDRHAPDLVDKWADRREAAGEVPAKVKEARDCATAMRVWRERHRPTVAPPDPFALARSMLPRRT